MYAIVEIAGKQFKVTKDQHIYAPLMADEAGASIELDKVLLMGDGDDIKLGDSAVSGARVAATVVEHVKDDKVIVFKKKRRKGYKKKQGHRQQYTKLLIDEILASGQQASPKKKQEPKPEPTPVETAPQDESPAAEPAQVLPASDELTPAPVDRDPVDRDQADVAETTAEEQPDDLKNISGVGPVFENELHDRGVHTYQQLIDLSSDEIEKLDAEIDGVTREMIEDDWIPQAKELMNK